MEKGNEYRTTVVCVDSYENKTFVGRFYNPYRDGVGFDSLTQFLLRMDDMLNEMRLPQSFTAVRAFHPANTEPDTPPQEQPREGKLATFAVRILFRQNASWQGSVTWLEGKREETFRSVLELIFLMDSALEERR